MICYLHCVPAMWGMCCVEDFVSECENVLKRNSSVNSPNFWYLSTLRSFMHLNKLHNSLPIKTNTDINQFWSNWEIPFGQRRSTGIGGYIESVLRCGDWSRGQTSSRTRDFVNNWSFKPFFCPKFLAERKGKKQNWITPRPIIRSNTTRDMIWEAMVRLRECRFLTASDGVHAT